MIAITNPPKILVSTQVVEVSLDLDFQQGFTEPAPIDTIVQRLGRINRRASLGNHEEYGFSSRERGFVVLLFALFTFGFW